MSSGEKFYNIGIEGYKHQISTRRIDPGEKRKNPVAAKAIDTGTIPRTVNGK